MTILFWHIYVDMYFGWFEKALDGIIIVQSIGHGTDYSNYFLLKPR